MTPLGTIPPAHLAAGVAWLGALSLGAGLLIARGSRGRRAGLLVVLAALALALGFLLAHWRYAVGNRGDAWTHLALICEAAEDGLFPGDAYFPGAPTPPQYGLFHVLGGVAVAAGANAALLWLAACAGGLALRLIAVYLLAALVLEERRLAALAAVLSLLVPAGETADPWTMARPFATALSLMLLAHWALLRAVKREAGPPGYAAGGLLLGLCAGWHLFAGIMAFGSTLLILLAHCVAERAVPRRRVLGGLALSGAAGLAIASPWIAHAALLYLRHGAGGHAERYGSIGVALGGLRWLRIARPGAAAALAGGPGMAVLALLGGGLCARRALWGRDRHAAYLALGLLAALALLFTPLFGLMEKLFGRSMAARTPALARSEMLAVLGLTVACWGAAWFWARWRAPPDRLGLLVGVVVIAALTSWAAKPFTARMIYRARRYPGAQSDHAFFAAHPALARALRGRVALSDRWTSYRARYYFGCKAVLVPPGLGNPYAQYGPREELVARVLAGRLAEPRTRELGRRFPFSHVLVNRRLAEQVAMEPDELARLAAHDEAALRRSPRTEPVYESDEFALYAVHPIGGPSDEQ